MRKSTLKINLIYQMIYQFLNMILPLIISPYLARIIGAEGMGVYSYSYSVAYFFVIFSNLGINNLGNREIAKVRDDKEKTNQVFSNLITIHLIVSCFFASLYVIYVVFLAIDKKIALIQVLYVLSGLFDISWFHFGIENFKIIAIANSIMKIGVAILIFSLVNAPVDVWKYCLIMAGGFFACQTVLWIPLHGYVKFVKPEKKVMRSFVKPLCVLFIPVIAVSLYRYMDKIMVGMIMGKIELGWYENAEKIIDVPMGIIAAFGTVMMPRMSNLAVANRKDDFKRYIEISMKYIMFIGFAVAFGLAGVGRVFAPVFWGNDFVKSGNLILCLSATIPFLTFANILRTQYLIPNDYDREYVISIVSGALVNVVVNIVLIPKYGSLGASMATIGAEATVCLLQTYAVRKELPLEKYVKSFLPFLLSGIVMFIVVFLLGENRGASIYTLFAQIMLGGSIYITLSSVYLWHSKDEVFGRLINKDVEKKG